MSMAGLLGQATKLVELLKEKLRLDARGRFIVLFALFDAMFAALLLVLLQNMNLATLNTQLTNDNRQLGESLTRVEASATQAIQQIATLESALRELQPPISTLTIAVTKESSTPTPLIPAATVTVTLKPGLPVVTDMPIALTPTPQP